MQDLCKTSAADWPSSKARPSMSTCWPAFPPTVAISPLVNSLKGGYSHRLRQEFPNWGRHYWPTRRPWSRPYFAGPADDAPITIPRRTSNKRTTPA